MHHREINFLFSFCICVHIYFQVSCAQLIPPLLREHYLGTCYKDIDEEYARCVLPWFPSEIIWVFQPALVLIFVHSSNLTLSPSTILRGGYYLALQIFLYLFYVEWILLLVIDSALCSMIFTPGAPMHSSHRFPLRLQRLWLTPSLEYTHAHAQLYCEKVAILFQSLRCLQVIWEMANVYSFHNGRTDHCWGFFTMTRLTRGRCSDVATCSYLLSAVCPWWASLRVSQVPRPTCKCPIPANGLWC